MNYTLKDAIRIIKSLFSAPLGSYPKGGVESALRVRLNISPNTISLISEHSLTITLRRDTTKWVVIYLGEESYYSSLDEAIFALIEPIIHDEISHRM
jgi:hypothetical protein